MFETLNHLMQQSVGAGAGIALGSLVGLGIRKKRGKTDGLVGGSVIVTAAVFGMAAMAVMMLMKYLWG